MKEKMKNDKLTTSEIVEHIEEIAPAGLQEDWDNSGLIIGFEDKRVDRVLTCLEIDERVVLEAKAMECEMIVSHHPLIFNGVRNMRSSEPQGRTLIELIKNGISVYSCHTPFDKVRGGNNDWLAETIGLEDIRNLAGEKVRNATAMMEKRSKDDIGRMGKFKQVMSLRQVSTLICDRLELTREQIRPSGDLDSEIERVGLCSGAGADLIERAAAAGCQLFVTGDVTHHEAQSAVAAGICVIDAGHYGTEKMFGRIMADKLSARLKKKAELIVSAVNTNPFTY